METAKVNVQGWVDRGLRDQLAALAREGDRTVSAEVRRAIAAYLRERSAAETREPVAPQ